MVQNQRCVRSLSPSLFSRSLSYPLPIGAAYCARVCVCECGVSHGSTHLSPPPPPPPPPHTHTHTHGWPIQHTRTSPLCPLMCHHYVRNASLWQRPIYQKLRPSCLPPASRHLHLNRHFLCSYPCFALTCSRCHEQGRYMTYDGEEASNVRCWRYHGCARLVLRCCGALFAQCSLYDIAFAQLRNNCRVSSIC